MAGGQWLLCADGEWPPESVWGPLSEACDVIVGVDGGTDAALSRNLEVTMATGDFDSITDTEVERIALPNQNSSDLEKTLQYAFESEAEVVKIIGVEGGEIDHQLAAFAALVEAPSELEISMHMSEHIVMRCLDDLELVLDAGTKLSLFAFTACANVSISGVEFPLDGEPLAFSTRGLHNVALGGSIHIESDGALVVVISAH
ncbi:MAG: thiamine diphosphokinase [Candidatus Thalassarchaeaceae archaeon]|nr:thiamine diphosphokinase [Candidatus Thalassarchaeaceae archaeon]